jgi:hypothetical protein
MTKPNVKELLLVRWRITARLEKTEANGCTLGEAALRSRRPKSS